MAGIYIHIPFCKQLCNYCDFYKSVSFDNKNALIEALCKEFFLQKDYLDHEPIQTIYFGGGTPSVLTAKEIEKLLQEIYKHFDISENPEITFEANPDDLSNQYLRDLRKVGINRLSIGIQSFFKKELVLMNRRHTSCQAVDAIMKSQDEGFYNISIDLIYGIPGMSLHDLESNLNIIFNLNIQHISAYHLNIEPHTIFEKWINKRKIERVNERDSINQFRMLIERMEQSVFIQYEISNFGKEGFFSIHNSNYWKRKRYLGIGPSSHSYNLKSRQWNTSDNNKYLEYLQKDKIPFEIEYLDTKTKYNDYVLTSLRTMWGINLDFINNNFGETYKNNCIRAADPIVKDNKLTLSGNIIKLTDEGKFIADNIISCLLITD